ncbi:MAG: hypothetical protein AABO41_06030 [Acidobacteriota bacterium]
MGLDAIVYRASESIGLDAEDMSAAIVDGQTGEVYFEAPNLEAKYGRDKFVATEKRLGNVSHIALIRSQIPIEISSSIPLLLNNILRSGSHSGDVIGSELLDELEAEIHLVRRKTAGKELLALDGFLDDMMDLAEVARSQKHPIVFV